MNRPICVLTIIVMMAIIGLYSCGVVFFDYDKVYELDGATQDFEGIILGKKSETDYKATYIIEINEAQNSYTQKNNSKNNEIGETNENMQNENEQEENKKTADTQIFVGKKFLLDVKKKDYSKELEYGDIITFNAIYNKPNSQRNYGGYDYSLYLKTQTIYGTFEGSQLQLKSKNKGSFIQKGIISFKEHIKSILKANLDENEAELCIGLVIGDRTNLSENIQEDFKTSNLTHMLAVSGSHFVYIILAVTYINKFLKRKRLGQVLMLIVIVLFMNLTGNTGSVVRSGIMAALGIIASIIHRKADIWNNMAIALLIQIILNPYIIFDVGVQLSYGGVIGIVAFNKIVTNQIEQLSNKIREKFANLIKGKNKKNEIIKIQNYEDKKEIANKSWNLWESICNYIKESISVTISANIVIIPIMMYTFNTISLSFVISNLLAGAILGIIVLYAFALIFLYMVLHKFISPLFIILNIMLKILISIAHICSLIPFSKIYVVTPNVVLIIFFYLFLYLLVKKQNSMILSKKTIAFFTIAIVILNFIYPVITSKRDNLEINFIDVGQGDSTLIRVSNKTILIDGGGSSYGETFDVGEQTLFPYLLDRGINEIDYVIVSHFDSDHCQGLNFVMKNMKVKSAIISSLGQESNEYDTFINLAQKQETNLIFVKKGDIIKIGDCTIKILYPDNEPITDNEKNNNALVFKFMWKNISILFTGDIEEKAENKILNLYEENLEELQSTILKVAHHGSKTSTTKEFLEAVKPQIALVGVGEDNNFGHPNSGVIERLESIGCKIYRTDECGEISFKFKNQISVSTKISSNMVLEHFK